MSESRRARSGPISVLSARLPGVDTWAPVGGPRLEARWFVEGALPRQFRPQGPSVWRVDAYHLASLTEDLTVKRRGCRAELECKSRSRVEPLHLAGVPVGVERWQKWRARHRDGCEPAGPWVSVAKQIWSFDGLEVARLSTNDTSWWTFALTVRSSQPTMTRGTTRWLRRLGGEAQSGSYGTWLLRCHERAEAGAPAVRWSALATPTAAPC